MIASFPSNRSPWIRHTIDNGSKGADGVRVGDINGDRLPDLATGWEEGGEVRVYLNPGPRLATHPWPKVIVGHVPSPEDAVFADVNGDGRLDVVSSCEGRERSVHVHLAPHPTSELLDSNRWTSGPIPALQGRSSWMFCLPLQVDGLYGTDLVIGAKGQDAVVGWLQSPASPEGLNGWTWHPLTRAGWIMSLSERDLDGDGDPDIVYSDRQGEGRGVWWLEHPGMASAPSAPWRKHPIAGQGREVMFLDLGDLDGDGMEDVVCAVRGEGLLVARRLPGSPPVWRPETIPMPSGVGNGKGVAIGDLDMDGRMDLVVTCEGAKARVGVFGLIRTVEGGWAARDISGKEAGVKFDRIELLDLDADGDLDVVTCEEADNLGVIWYENPAR